MNTIIRDTLAAIMHVMLFGVVVGFALGVFLLW